MLVLASQIGAWNRTKVWRNKNDIGMPVDEEYLALMLFSWSIFCSDLPYLSHLAPAASLVGYGVAVVSVAEVLTTGGVLW
jgi:hypothetical protein